VEFGVIECLADSAIDRGIEVRDRKKRGVGHRSQAASMHDARGHKKTPAPSERSRGWGANESVSVDITHDDPLVAQGL
jgi:hypothetical protein